MPVKRTVKAGYWGVCRPERSSAALVWTDDLALGDPLRAISGVVGLENLSLCLSFPWKGPKSSRIKLWQ